MNSEHTHEEMPVFLQVAAEAARAVQRSSQDRSEGERDYHGFVSPERYQMSGGAFVAEMKSQTTREPLPSQDRNQLSATANAAVAAQLLYLQRPHCGRAKAEF